MKRFGSILLVAVTVAACASPRQQVASGLVQMGLSRDSARCVADGLDRRLSGDQMRQVAKLMGGASRAGQVDMNERNIRKALSLAIGVADPEIVTAASRTLVACTIIGG